jgi:hypothetical protein
MDANELLDSHATLVQLVAEHTFNCLELRSELIPLSAPYYKHLPTLDVVENLLDASGVVFAPGLLDVLLSDEPPTLDYFKSLPTVTETTEAWGVYVISLEKAEFQPLAYIGSGTNSDRGVKFVCTTMRRVQTPRPYLSTSLRR